jgi:hypothetical protein
MLNGLAILCIDKDMVEHTNIETIIIEFASKNVRI